MAASSIISVYSIKISGPCNGGPVRNSNALAGEGLEEPPERTTAEKHGAKRKRGGDNGGSSSNGIRGQGRKGRSHAGIINGSDEGGHMIVELR